MSFFTTFTTLGVRAMNNQQFIDILSTKLEGRLLKLTKHMFYVLAYGADDVIWLITDGVVLAERNNADGTQIGCGIYGPGMLAGITALNGESGVFTCKPLKDTTVQAYRTKELIDLMQSDSELMMYIIQFLCGRFRFMMNSLEMNSLRSVPERIEYFERMLLLYDDPNLLDYGDNVVAEYLGIHPASISRARRKMHQEDKEKPNNN